MITMLPITKIKLIFFLFPSRRIAFRTGFRLGLCAVLLCCTNLTWAQTTNESQEVSRLLKAGQLDQAMNRADAYLATKPRDAQMRFLKGLILTEQNKAPEAIQVFTRLTEDYPELPEPYNNLAVLYAAQGQYEKARAALELAIRTHPSYATAHENLGDVYAKLASQAYDKALQLDSNNKAAQIKLSLARELIGGSRNQITTINSTTSATKPTAVAASVAPQTSSTPPSASVPKAEPLAAENKTTPTTKASAETKQATPENKPNGKIASPSNTSQTQEEVLAAVKSWAQAWSNKDMSAYLAAYSADFKTPKGMNRQAWEKERRIRIEGKRKIDVAILDPKVTLKGNTATVKFRQDYQATGFTANSHKTLIFIKTNGKWLIKEERSGG